MQQQLIIKTLVMAQRLALWLMKAHSRQAVWCYEFADELENIIASKEGRANQSHKPADEFLKADEQALNHWFGRYSDD